MTFKPGDPKPPNSGRRKGTTNKATAKQRKLALMAAAIVGKEVDPEAEDGLLAFYCHAARTELVAYLGYMRSLMPKEIVADVNNDVTVTALIQASQQPHIDATARRLLEEQGIKLLDVEAASTPTPSRNGSPNGSPNGHDSDD